MSKRKSNDEDAEYQKRLRTEESQPSPSPQLVATDAAAARPRAAGFTLRITNIPSSITEEHFLRTLNELPYGTCSGDGTGYQQNVLGWSFAPSAASADSEMSRSATVTLKSVPVSLQFKSTFISIHLFGGVTPAIVDSHFYGLTPLNNPPEQPIVDIIAVTGLAGHAFGSWKSRGGYTMWLRDFLPENVPNARILTYGYDSTLLNNNSNASILEFSQNFLEALKAARTGETEKCRPIIFIGHSLGGLVIKQALVKAAQSDDDSENRFVFNSCHALLLFGVPNKGLEGANLRSMVKGQPNTKLIENLEGSSDFLRHLHELWESFGPRGARIVSIYETKPTPTVLETPTGWKRVGPEVLMVSRDSATHATPKENPHDIFSIDANHSEIVKFDNKTCQEYLNVRSRIINLVQDAHEMRAYVLFRTRYGERRRGKILKWLSKIEYKKHHQNAKEGLLENTGQWLVEKEQYRRWRYSRVSGILWLHGIPGAGKTKLTCMVIATLESQAQNSGGDQWREPVVYFYCNRNEPLRRDPTAIMQAIVKQLSLARPNLPGLPKSVVAEYDKRVKDGFASGSLGFQENYELVVSLLGMYSQTTIVIDALDESDPKERWRLLEALKAIIQSSTGLVKIFVSSRDDVDITLKLANVPNLYIDARDNGGDIGRFVYREVAQSIESGRLLCGHITDELKEQIISAILTKAKGMFQWADLQIKHLLEMNSEDDIRENLGGLPETLEETYSQIYKAIRSERPHAQDVTRKALMWIMCARKLLTREAWAEASYWPKMVPKDGVHTLFKLCRNLVTWDSQLNAVRFAHLSVREYLESKLTSVDANSMAAECCLSLFDSAHWLGARDQGFGGEFVKYSIIYWPDHIRSSYEGKHRMSSDILGRLRRFLGAPADPGQAYCNWFQSAITNLDLFQGPERRELNSILCHLRSTPLNPLFAWSYFRFGEPQEQLEYDSFDINCMNNYGETSLFVASMRGNEGIVNILLGKGADANAGGNKYTSNPLMAAIKGEYGEIVVKLLDKGAGVSKRCAYANVLEAAAGEGGKTVMRTIMDRGANIEVTKEVIVAARGNLRSSKEVMEQLLAEGINTKITKAATVAIVGWFCKGIVKLLLAKKHHIEVTGGLVMVAAGNRDKQEIMRLLLEKNTNTNITSVAAAVVAREFDKEMMKLLLAKEPDIVITEAVVIAAAANRVSGLEIVKLLLAKKHHIEVTGGLVMAAAGNRDKQEIMRLLLEKNTNTNITSVAAAVVAREFDKEMMKLLLAKEPDIVITEAVVIAAAANLASGPRIVELLLAREPHIEITEKVVIAAAANLASGPRIVELLLAREPHIEITEKVVIAAAANRDSGPKVVELLLAREPHIEITKEVVMRVTRKRHSGKRVMVMLLAIDSVSITKAAVEAVAGEFDREVMKLLLASNLPIEITKAVVMAAAGKFDKEIMELLLAREPNIEITEEVMMAVAENWRYGNEVMAVLLARYPGLIPPLCLQQR